MRASGLHAVAGNKHYRLSQKYVVARCAMTLQTISFVFGAILLAVAILGGGFEIKEIKVANATIPVRVISGIVGLVFIGLGFWQPMLLREPGPGGVKMSQREDAKDRLGGDYFDFDVKIDHIEDCESACKGDTKCSAWTYVKPGYRGPLARCYLKSVAPAMSDNTCCVSGRKIR
jgi:hypothetical protein